MKAGKLLLGSVSAAVVLTGLSFADLAAAADTTSPTVTITSPAEGHRVGGLVTISANAEDDVGTVEMRFYKDDVLIDTDTVAPFSAETEFNTAVPNRNYVLKAVAKDAAGNVGTATITVNKPNHDFRGNGATITDNGAFFKVWAPHARSVALEGDFNGWNRFSHYLWNENGWWYGFQPGVTAGQKYKFVINNELHRPDPYGRQMEHSAGASIVKDAAAFHWNDGAWRTPAFEDMIVYELHVGTFIGKNDGQPYPGRLQTLISKLDYIKSTGANMIELLPLHEVPGPDGPTPYLGYAPTGLFAVESAYSSTGSAYDDLKAFVNAAHSKGLGVILDVVYNHFSDVTGRDNWYWNYDGDSEFEDGGIYFNRQQTPWGSAPDWGRNEVSNYIEQNCRYWLSEFHFDGLRWDFTNQIKDKPSGWDRMRGIVQRLKQDFPSKIQICENLPYEKAVVEPDGQFPNGGFHTGWYVDFHHKLEASFKAGSAADVGSVWAGLNGGDYSHVTKRVIYAMSHDEARNGGSYLVTEFGGRGNWDARAKARAMASLLFMSPGIPMIWQGEEFAQDGWFTDNWDNAVNWSYQYDPDGSRMLNLYRDASATRWKYNALRNGPFVQVHEDPNNKVIAFRRDWGEQSILVIANFGENTFGQREYGVSTGKPGQWTQILCSQDAAYGGWVGAGNAFYEPWTQADGKIYINVPKFSVVAMKLK